MHRGPFGSRRTGLSCKVCPLYAHDERRMRYNMVSLWIFQAMLEKAVSIASRIGE